LGSVAEWQNCFNEGNFLPFGFWCRNLPVSFCAFLVSSCPSTIDLIPDDSYHVASERQARTLKNLG